jgi:transcriptional regulator with XRE-family HTH domain
MAAAALRFRAGEREDVWRYSDSDWPCERRLLSAGHISRSDDATAGNRHLADHVSRKAAAGRCGRPFARANKTKRGKEHCMTERHIMKPTGDGADARAREGNVWSAIGSRLTLRRSELGLSAERIADRVGVPVYDYKDYENGAPIPAFLLGEIAELLDRPVTWFFEGIAQGPQDEEARSNAQSATYRVATVEHRIQALTDSFRKLDFEGQQHLLAISRALSLANAGAAHE